MSADNAIFVTENPSSLSHQGLYWVAAGSVSRMNELEEEHWFTPEQYAQATENFFHDGEFFMDQGAAINHAFALECALSTEHGVIQNSLRFGPGVVPDELLEKPKPPEGSCPHCSTGGSYTFHGEGGRYDTQCRNPDSIYNVIRLALQKETTGLNVALVTRIVVEALKEADE